MNIRYDSLCCRGVGESPVGRHGRSTASRYGGIGTRFRRLSNR